jgi:membrane fusion protein (multidrug efflux system)
MAAELAGKVVRIAFEPGTKVRAGDLLVKQDSTTEEAQLRSAEAQIALAQNNFNRIEQLFSRNAISRADFDNADAQLRLRGNDDWIRFRLRRENQKQLLLKVV